MNRKYIVTGKEITISFEFDPEGNLMEIKTSQPMTKEQWQFVAKNLPWVESKMDEWKQRFTNIKIEAAKEYDFEDFWNAYKYKVQRADALKAWNKLTPEDKHKAVGGIRKYKAHCEKTGQALRYPERYLTRRSWEDEY